MEEGTAERLRVQDRMIEAALAQDDDPGWSAQVMPAGLKVTYTWRHDNGNFYTVEALTSWTSLERARINPLLVVMADLLKQKTEFKA